MRIDLDELITLEEPDDLSSCSIAELRIIREQYQEVESGLSYIRRIVQGRLDTLSMEIERRADAAGADLLGRLPEALAAHTRGPGLPRPVRDLEPPPWADDALGALDGLLTPAQLAELGSLEDAALIAAAERTGEIEREVSAQRHEMHRRIDRIQDELIGRYRDGATVDDLLQ